MTGLRSHSSSIRSPVSSNYLALKVNVLPTCPQLFHVLLCCYFLYVQNFEKKLQSHFEISWPKIECHPKCSLEFKHPCQSWLSSPGDFYPNNRSLWWAWPEGLWAIIMSKIRIYWVMQINKKGTGSPRPFFFPSLLSCLWTALSKTSLFLPC